MRSAILLAALVLGACAPAEPTPTPTTVTPVHVWKVPATAPGVLV